MTISKHYASAASATSGVLAQSATFTRAWYLAQPGMTPCFWRFASKLGMRAGDHVPADGDKVGDKGGHFLLAVVPADQPGKRHKRASKTDAGDPYKLSPFGRFIYGKRFKSLVKADADQPDDQPDDQASATA